MSSRAAKNRRIRRSLARMAPTEHAYVNCNFFPSARYCSSCAAPGQNYGSGQLKNCGSSPSPPQWSRLCFWIMPPPYIRTVTAPFSPHPPTSFVTSDHISPPKERFPGSHSSPHLPVRAKHPYHRRVIAEISHDLEKCCRGGIVRSKYDI